MKNDTNNKCAINEGKLEVKEDFLRVNADLVCQNLVISEVEK